MRKIIVLLLLLLMLAVGVLLIHHQQPLPVTVSGIGCVDIPASPDYLSTNSESDAIVAINNAHTRENLPPLRLPGNYYHLGPSQQQFILLNIERTDRGLLPLEMDATLSQMALGYSRQLSNLHFFSHTSPISGTFTDRDDSAESSGHRLNILDPTLTRVGINWVRNSQYGSISDQEFLASPGWNLYSHPSPDTIA